MTMHPTHPSISSDNWFHEINQQWPGQSLSLKVNEILHTEKSKYQDVLVFQSSHHGNVLVLDNVIQVTERDEFSYQEMIAHLPLCSHGAPKKVLVIGGGDGGVLREIVKNECVESVTLVEIDEAVIRVSKKYLPSMAVGFQHPKVNVVVGDGFAYLKENQDAFDVIITDSSDPVGPAESLFKESFYELLYSALKPGGVVCCQGECMWLHLNFIKNVMENARNVFPLVEYAYASVPTYPSGQIGFILCAKNPEASTLSVPKFIYSREFEDSKLKYYNSRVHAAAFELPTFANKALQHFKSM